VRLCELLSSFFSPVCVCVCVNGSRSPLPVLVLLPPLPTTTLPNIPPGVAHCAYSVVRTEGPRALFVGWSAAVARFLPQTAGSFLLLEEGRRRLGMEAF